jgi:hypothetical protein
MLEEINRLLNETQTLQFYETKLMEATGGHFNVFEILQIGSREVTTHSPMLAELLNPQGRHGMGSKFLDIFAEQFSLELDSPARIEQEHWVGPKNEDSGGRIDILITDKKSHEVVIENKIYATDQEQQTIRYLKSRPRANVLFLTLDGREPTEKVTSKDKARFRCISYARDIIQWLDDCRKEATHAPLVRETIAQYINLIKVLTGQNTNSRMRDQITESILRSPATLEAYFTLVRNKEDVINEIVKILEVQCKEIGAEFSLHVDFGSIEYNPYEIGDKYGGFFFFDEKMKKRNLYIAFQFHQKDFRGLVFGIARVDEEKGAMRTDIANRFDDIFGECRVHSLWAAFKPWPGKEDWWNDGTFRDIYSGEFKKELQEKVEKMVEILRDPALA